MSNKIATKIKSKEDMTRYQSFAQLCTKILQAKLKVPTTSDEDKKIILEVIADRRAVRYAQQNMSALEREVARLKRRAEIIKDHEEPKGWSKTDLTDCKCIVYKQRSHDFYEGIITKVWQSSMDGRIRVSVINNGKFPRETPLIGRVTLTDPTQEQLEKYRYLLSLDNDAQKKYIADREKLRKEFVGNSLRLLEEVLANKKEEEKAKAIAESII